MTKLRWIWGSIVVILAVGGIVVRLCGLFDLSHVVSEFMILALICFFFFTGTKPIFSISKVLLIVAMFVCTLSVVIFSITTLLLQDILTKALSDTLELITIIITAISALSFYLFRCLDPILARARKQ